MMSAWRRGRVVGSQKRDVVRYSKEGAGKAEGVKECKRHMHMTS